MLAPCVRCGAAFDDVATHCPYCNTITSHGVKVAEQKAADDRVKALELEKLRAQRQAQVQRDAQRSLWPSLFGLLLCFPLSLISVFRMLLAARTARQNNFPLPVRGKIGLIVGLFGLAQSTGLWAFYLAERAEAQDRRAELTGKIRKWAHADALDRDTACSMAELNLLDRNWFGALGVPVLDFECTGSVDQRSQLAQLGGIQYSLLPGRPTASSACFTKSGDWRLLGLTACSGFGVTRPSAPPKPSHPAVPVAAGQASKPSLLAGKPSGAGAVSVTPAPAK